MDIDVAAAVTNETARARQLFDALKVNFVQFDEEMADIALEGETNFIEIASMALQRIIELDALVEANKAIAAELSARKERLEKSCKEIKDAIKKGMVALDKKKLELPNGTISVSKPKNKLVIESADQIPDKFKTTEFLSREVILTDELQAALEKSEYVEGARLDEVRTLTVRKR